MLYTNENGKGMDTVVSDERIESDLMNLPQALYEADLAAVNLARDLREYEESLDFAETNALLSATIDGKNEETRKLQRSKVLQGDAEVNIWRGKIHSTKKEQDELTARSEMLRRRFAAVCYMAELRAGQLHVMAKGH